MKNLIFPFPIAALAAACLPLPLFADSVEKKAEDDSPEAELASFEVTAGYDVNLFASEEHGIANPICMNWDGKGRLWVLCSLVYPHLVPTESANDRLYILEDTDGDGVADRSGVFADGLNLPTGFALGDGGVYVGEGANLVFLSDTDGDDRADHREIIFSGFGTGDTHQNINSLTWSPGGELYFCQGLHAFSRVETPWGISRLDEHGVWRARPRRRQLHGFKGIAGQNPWGVVFGHWGEGFVKGNGTTLCELTPFSLTTEYRPRDIPIGATEIKSMVPLIVDSPHFPDDLQGNILIAGYYAHVIDRMTLEPALSGHTTKNLPPLLRTDHRSFRPVDLKTGPDGAIYIADWYNPIIGHYQASLRHPDRDKKHGRIWRVTARGRDPLEKPRLEKLDTGELVERLASPIRYERDRVRELLSGKPTEEVIAALSRWLEGRKDEHHLYEAAAVFTWHEEVNPALLESLLSAKNPLARAYGARLTGRWQDRLDAPEAKLERLVGDSHPRVRLEAVVACGSLSSPGAITIALRALDHPLDPFLEGALTHVSHALKPVWFPALSAGDLSFENPDHLAFALAETSGSDAGSVARDLLGKPGLSATLRSTLLILLAGSKKPGDQLLAFNRGSDDPAVLGALGDAAELHGSVPEKPPVDRLRTLIEDESTDIRSAAIRLAGLWKLKALSGEIRGRLSSGESGEVVSAMGALARLEGKGAVSDLEKIARSGAAIEIRTAAIEEMANLDLEKTAGLVSGLFENIPPAEAGFLVIPFAGRKDGLRTLGSALKGRSIPGKTASQIRTVLGAAGHFSKEMDAALGITTGETIGLPEFDQSLVNDLARSASENGDPLRGKEVFNRPELGCVACHRIGGESAAELGPELSAVGAGLPMELIAEAVLWPARQVKEGYLSTMVTTRDGKVVSGYLESETGDVLSIRNAATGQVESLAKGKVASRINAGTLMPRGLTANLTRSELEDLLRYLASLKGRTQ